MKIALLTVGLFLIAVTVLSRVRGAHWWVRLADFPRLQFAVLLAFVGVAFIPFFDAGNLFDSLFAAGLLGSLAYQCRRIYPYTRLAPRSVRDASPGRSGRSIRLLISNVLMENRRADDLIARVREHDPDLVLAVETDAWWEQRLRVLDDAYPHRVKQPQENYYGMIFLSKLELAAAEIRFLVEEDIPSLRAEVRLRSGDVIEFHGIHPRPPVPQQDTEQRDAELLIVGGQVRGAPLPTIVAGDLNDVAWSHTTRLFMRISGLLDPRCGRGMFSTFHARYPIFRWPLDHVFHDHRFTLVRLERLPAIGSDHFPVLAELAYEPAAAPRQEEPEPDGDDLDEARERVEDAREADR